jgi:hypothetical protein
MKRPLSIPLLGLVLLGAVAIAMAQEEVSPAPQQEWSSQQLENLVAPIALYPDPLLSQILAASTYPLEVVEANQWLQQNRNLRGEELIAAAKRQSWDPSIQALVAVPDALAKLNQDIRWTTDLGNAFLSQQSDVMSAVQTMRSRAQDNGRLSSTPQQRVNTQRRDGQNVIVIQPADPEVIYVPVYDPAYIWGPPVYGYYPALYYPGFGFSFGPGFNLGFYFGGWWGWNSWGWGLNWYNRTVFVNNQFFYRHGFHCSYANGFRGPTIWRHDPIHRLRVAYGNPQVTARFGRNPVGPRNSFRAGGEQGRAVAPYTNRSEGRAAGRTMSQPYRSISPQVQRSQSPERPRYQSVQPNRAAPQNRSFQNQPLRTYQSQTPRQFSNAPRVSAPRSSGFSRSSGGSFNRNGGSGGGGRHR